MAGIIYAGIHKAYTKVDKGVTSNKDLSDGAFRLYTLLVGLDTSKSFNETYMANGLGLSKSQLTRRKKELADHGLIFMHQLSPRNYLLFIGTSQMNAAQMFADWEQGQ